MRDSMIEAYKKAHALHLELTQTLVDLEREVKTCGDVQALADDGYALRETMKMVDATLKDLGRVQKLVATMFGVVWSMDPNAPDRVKTEWCSCAADIKEFCAPPDPEAQPVEFAEVCRAIGIPEDSIKSGAIKLSFNGLADWMAHARREGKNLPEVLQGKIFKQTTLNIIQRRKLSSVLAEASLGSADDNDEEYF